MNIKSIFKAYPIAFVACGAIILFGGIGIYRNAVLSDVKEDLASKNDEAARLSENLHNAQRLDTQLTQMGNLNQKISARLSIPTDVAANQQYFYKMETESGVKLLDLRPQNFSARGGKKNTMTRYSTVGYTLSVQGDFTHLLAFLRNFESGSRIGIATEGNVTPVTAAKSNEDQNSSAPLVLNLDVELLGAI